MPFAVYKFAILIITSVNYMTVGLPAILNDSNANHERALSVSYQQWMNDTFFLKKLSSMPC